MKTSADVAAGREPETRDGVEIALDMLSAELIPARHRESVPTLPSLGETVRSTSTLICDRAAIEAQANFREEYESTTCAVCGKDKWRLYPFCRDCSVKLQRAGLMQYLVQLVVWNSDGKREPDNWEPQIFRQYVKAYDRCRDFLIVTKRIPFSRKKVQDLD